MKGDIRQQLIDWLIDVIIMGILNCTQSAFCNTTGNIKIKKTY